MEHTTYLNLNLPEGSDIVNPLTDTNPNFTIIDNIVNIINPRLVTSATHSVSGTVHNVTRSRIIASLMPSPCFRFVASGNWKAGDTLKVDNIVIQVCTPDGQPLDDDAFVAGQIVYGAVGSGNSIVTLAVSNKYTPTASEVTTAGGDSVQDYIDNTKFKNLETWTPNIGENWETFLARIRDNSTKTIPANFIRCTVDGVSGLIFRQSRRTSATSWQYETDYFTGNSLVKYAMSVGSDSAVLRKYDILNGTVQNLSSADAQTINIYGLDV